MANPSYADQFNEYFNSEEEKIAFLETKTIDGWWSNFFNHLTSLCFKYNGVEIRYDYWRFIGIFALINVVLIILANLFDNSNYYYYGHSTTATLINSINLIFSLWGGIASLAANCRRLHDINNTGWLQLIVLIPFVGSIILLILYIKASNYSSNKYLYEEAVKSGFIRNYRKSLI